MHRMLHWTDLIRTTVVSSCTCERGCALSVETVPGEARHGVQIDDLRTADRRMSSADFRRQSRISERFLHNSDLFNRQSAVRSL